LTFSNVLGEYFISHEKSGHVQYFTKRTFGNHTLQCYSYTTCVNLSKADRKVKQNLPEMSRDVS